MPRWDDREEVACELDEQARYYQAAGFHHALDIEKSVFRDRIMRLAAAQPEGYRKKFTTPVVVFGPRSGISIFEQCARAGVRVYHDLSGVSHTCPKGMYLTWMQDGSRPVFSRENGDYQFASHERGATVYDAVAWVLTHEDVNAVLADHYINLPGTKFGPHCVARLGRRNRKVDWSQSLSIGLTSPYAMKQSDHAYGTATCGM